MPLGTKAGFEKSQSRYCGVETEFNDDMPQLLNFNLSTGAFDFVVAPLMNPTYRPSLLEKDGVLPFAASDLVLSPSQWSSHVVGKISSWIDLDSEDETIRMDSETTLKQEIAWANHLSIQACILPSPKGASCANYARCVNQILLGLNNVQLWLRIPLVKTDDDAMDANSTSFSFLTNGRGYPCLSKRHQKLITRFFNHSIQIVISGKPVHSIPRPSSDLAANNFDNNGESVQRHPLRPYLDYVGYLFQRMDPLPEQERFEPLMDNLEAQTYETFERDSMKYIQYQRAISKALLDRVPYEETSATTVLMVVGAGRGPLVRASLQAAEETGRKLKVYAVEKNPNAVVTLHSLVKLEGWEDIVTIISCDMRYWDAPEKADILVSELLGSFGDNELSPECLDGAQRFLKQDGISIPSSYTSFIQPVTTAKLYNDVKSNKDLVHFETAYVVKLHNVARLTPSQPVFTFTHPDNSTKKSNQRYKRLQFEIPSDTGSAMVHGFAGYFDAELYKDVHLGIEPSMATPNMFSWFAIFFPLRTPVCVKPGSPLEVHFWRCCGSSKEHCSKSLEISWTGRIVSNGRRDAEHFNSAALKQMWMEYTKIPHQASYCGTYRLRQMLHRELSSHGQSPRVIWVATHTSTVVSTLFLQLVLDGKCQYFTKLNGHNGLWCGSVRL
ncbi:unnamed protein product [Dovyalis caffra]|uniref:Protein arginine N-methyltransferase n=1 Tax=Dovyalis caffra TaxID=77055 RepID=A0AAV1SPM4_9ROSI|nr:unnamed protein product [Dovyalis caffra]